MAYQQEYLDELRRIGDLFGSQPIELFEYQNAAFVGYNINNVVGMTFTTSASAMSISGLEAPHQARTYEQARALGVRNVLRQAALANEDIARKSIFDEPMADELSFPAAHEIARPKIRRLPKRQ